MSEFPDPGDSAILPSPVRGNAGPVDPMAMLDDAFRTNFNKGQLAIEGLRDPQLTQFATEARVALNGADGVAQKVRGTVETIMGNLSIPLSDRTKLITETLAKVDDDLDERFRHASVRVEALRIVLGQAALPDPPDSRAASAELREDLQLRTQGLSESDLITTLVNLASGADRDLAAEIIHGRMVDGLLSHLPNRERDRAKAMIHTAAVAGSRMHGTHSKRAAAEAIAAVDSLTGAMAARKTAAKFRVDSAREVLTRAHTAQRQAFDNAERAAR